jgi:DNA-binding HxlR family transcriptional regulator
MKMKASFRQPQGRLLTEECSDNSCPIQFMLELLGSKWSVLILKELFGRDAAPAAQRSYRRTYQLLEALPGISSKTLTMRLRELEKYGLIQRTVYPEIPPRVEYSLTEKGRELQPIMLALKQVGQSWLGTKNCDCPLENINP